MPTPQVSGKLACLLTIDFERLEARDPHEMAKLLDACRNQGFFYLALGDKSSGLLDGWKRVRPIAEHFFEEPLETKMEFHRGVGKAGYKPIATLAGAVDGTMDRYEDLKMPQSELLADPSKLPYQVQQNISPFKFLVETSHYVTHTILSVLSDALKLHAHARLETKHLKTGSSMTTLEFIRYAKASRDVTGVGMYKHTDIGSLSLLLCEKWGLQVQCREHQCWEFVEPKRGLAVVNVGDTLSALSGGKLRAVIHRVVPVEEMKDEDRFTMAYFLRADDGTMIKGSDGEEHTVQDYYDRKYQAYRQWEEARKDWSIITGGMATDQAVAANAVQK